MTLDESRENDEIKELQGVRYLIDRQLLARCGSVTVDFVEEENWSGFALIAANPLLGRC